MVKFVLVDSLPWEKSLSWAKSKELALN